MLSHRTRRRLVRSVRFPITFVLAGVRGIEYRRHFSYAETYCQFIGYPRSGHTLIGALLNAHPDVVIANELGVLDWMRKGFSRLQLFAMILRRDRDFERQDYTFIGYQYAVPNQWQGRFRRIRVLGDKDAGRDTTQLRQRPELLDRLRRKLRLKIRVVHVVRNPYDALSTFVIRRKELGDDTTLDTALGMAVEALETVDRVIWPLGPGRSSYNSARGLHLRSPERTLQPLPLCWRGVGPKLS